MSANNESKEKAEGSVAVEKAANDAKEEEKADLVSDEISKEGEFFRSFNFNLIF